jgi:hypothetical protein
LQIHPQYNKTLLLDIFPSLRSYKNIVDRGVMRFNMHRVFALLLLFASAQVMADGMPKEVQLTPGNIDRLGFNLRVEVDPSDAGIRIVYFNFPLTVHGNWQPRRVQTYLFDKSGNEVTSTSADYKVVDTNPRILAHYQLETHDMAIVIQYFCKPEGGRACAEAYTISSVTQHLKDPIKKRHALAERNMNHSNSWSHIYGRR